MRLAVFFFFVSLFFFMAVSLLDNSYQDAVIITQETDGMTYLCQATGFPRDHGTGESALS